MDLRENFLRRLIAILGLAALAVLDVDPMLLSSSVLVCTLMVDSVAELSVVGDGILFIAPAGELANAKAVNELLDHLLFGHDGLRCLGLTVDPAPRIIAWQSNRNGELGFEWILMEKIQGVPMCDVWRKIPWERKLVLVEVLAGFIKEMQDQKFDSIGALYFKSALENIGGKRINAMAHESSTDVVAADEKPDISDQKQDSDTRESLVSTDFESLQLHRSSFEDTNRLKPVLESIANTPQTKPTLAGHIGKDDFAIGQLLDGLFIIRGRLYISGDRGPYSNPIQWLTALIHMELEWIKKYQTEGDDEYDSDLAE